MSRPRTPTAVLKLRGSFKKHPERLEKRVDEPQVEAPLGDPPTCLDEAERARWAELVASVPWLREPHRAMVEEVCRLWMAIRKGTAGPGDRKLFSTNLRALGLTPSDQSRVKMPGKAKPVNKFGELTG